MNIYELAYKEWQQERAKRDIVYFADEVLKIAEFNSKYSGHVVEKLNWHHYEWLKLLQEHKRICVMAPRDHWKTTIFSVVFPLWRILNRERGYIFSESQDQAIKILDRIKNIIENHPFFEKIRPDSAKTWNKREVELPNGAVIVTKSFGTSVRGAHPHFIVVDDPLGDKMRYSMDYVKKFFKRTITNMVLQNGWLILVGTPQRYDDLLMDIMQNPSYTRKKYQAVLDWDEKKVLWPEYYSWETLMQRREEIGSLAFDQEFMCEPVDESSSLFPYSLISQGFDSEATLISEYKGPWKVYIGCDLAISASTGADYTVFMTIAVDEFGNRHILDIFRAKGLSYKAQVQKIIELARRYNPRLILVESNQFQKIIADMLKEYTDLPVREYVTGRKKTDLTEGVPSLRVLFENKKVKIPRGDKRSIDATEVFVRELNAFGFREGKLEGIGEHDDTVMAFWIANEAVKQEKIGLQFLEW